MDRLEVKFAADDVANTGEFKGYAAAFGNIDTHGDVIVPGAFSETLNTWGTKGRLPPMKLMHGRIGNPFSGDDLPIGRWTVMREDGRGLYVEGKIAALDTEFGKRIYGLMKERLLDGLSIGYRAKAATRLTGAARRRLEAIELNEVSLVAEPSNDAARVAAVKSAAMKRLADLTGEDWREIEAVLRTKKDLSRADAVKAVSGLKEWLRRDAEEPETSPRDEDGAALAALLRRNIATLS